MFVGWVGAVDTCSVKLEATVMCLLVFLVSDIIGVTFLLWGGCCALGLAVCGPSFWFLFLGFLCFSLTVSHTEGSSGLKGFHVTGVACVCGWGCTGDAPEPSV